MMRRLMFFALGLMFGAAVGTALATLITPASGAELRRRAKAHVDNAVDAGRQAADKRRREMEAQFRTMSRPQRPTSSYSSQHSRDSRSSATRKSGR